MAADDNVQVKKIKPYPIATKISHGGQLFEGQILKLVMHGLLMDLGVAVVHVGEIYEIQFELPGLHQMVFTRVKAIKTYDKYQVTKDSKARRIAEFHFDHATSDVIVKVKMFLKAIKQIGTDLA